jgi:hypothetical protein
VLLFSATGGGLAYFVLVYTVPLPLFTVLARLLQSVVHLATQIARLFIVTSLIKAEFLTAKHEVAESVIVT